MWSWSVNNGCEFFSSCDLRWGYWQTKSDERDRDKTAFVTRKGQWRFKVLSFGLANAPSQFARIMELVMSGLTYDVCLVYLDDILVFSKTFDEHLDRLATVFYYRFSQPRDHLQWRLVLGYYDKVKLLTKGLLAKLA